MRHARILGTGIFLPEKEIKNTELFGNIRNFDSIKARESLQKRMVSADELSDEQVFDQWVKQVSGISGRRFFTEIDITGNSLHTSGSEVETMGALAARAALSDAGLSADAVDAVIFATITASTIIPNPGCTVAHYLNIPNAATLTVNTACSGFVDILGDAYAKIASGIHNTILLITSEKFSHKVDMGDPTTAILFGDGAAACVVGQSTEPGIQGYWSGSRISDYIVMRENSFLKMGGGPLVQKNAVNAMYDAACRTLEITKTNFEDYDYVIPHQANVRILQQLAHKMKIPEEKMLMTIDITANISCATIPSALDMLRKNRLPQYPYTKGQKILSTALGGGYTYAACAYTA